MTTSTNSIVPVPKASEKRIVKFALEAAESEGSVYSVLYQMQASCRDLSRLDIAAIVQKLIDADQICIALTEEDYLAYYKCVQPGQEEDTEAVYFTALEAFTEAERRWNLHHSEMTEQEKHLLKIMLTVSISGIVRVSELSEALQAHNLTVDAAWPSLELLSDRREIIFLRRKETGEIYIELQHASVELVNRHIALPELKKVLDLNQRVEERPKAFVLSKSIAAIGQTLSPEECTVLDTAQTLNAMFHRGGGVRETILHRVLNEYHNMEKAVRNQVIASLADRGFLKRTVEDRTKIMRSVFRFMGPARTDGPVDNPGIGQLIVKPEPVVAPACGGCETVAA